jgi:hypothetical protein
MRLVENSKKMALAFVMTDQLFDRFLVDHPGKNASHSVNQKIT